MALLSLCNGMVSTRRLRLRSSCISSIIIGTGVTLLGSTFNAAVDFFLDGALTQPNASSPETNILASFHNLSCIVHNLQMNIHITNDQPRSSSYVTFDKALIQFPSPSTQSVVPYCTTSPITEHPG